eukprot:scaffold111051_cov16-Prasinocladus_malaysianus.AAC.1
MGGLATAGVVHARIPGAPRDTPTGLCFPLIQGRDGPDAGPGLHGLQLPQRGPAEVWGCKGRPDHAGSGAHGPSQGICRQTHWRLLKARYDQSCPNLGWLLAGG